MQVYIVYLGIIFLCVNTIKEKFIRKILYRKNKNIYFYIYSIYQYQKYLSSA